MNEGGEILLYAGAGLQAPISDLAEEFQKETGVVVQCDFGGSGMVITRLKLAKKGDLFIPGDLWYVELAEKEGLIAETADICYLTPVIIVQKGNPKKIKTLADLARPGIRLGLGNVKTCQIGRVCEQLFEKNKIDKTAIEKNLLFSSATVNELGIQLQTGHLDAAIVWDATAKYYEKDTDAIPLSPTENIVSTVSATLLKSSGKPELAKSFVEFMRSEKGQAIFHKHNYKTKLKE